MSAPPFIWPSRIRFVDTDASTRIHYTALFRHFEAAEEEFFRQLGFPYTELERAERSYPRVHVEADYSGALKADDAIETHVALERVGRSSFTLRFRTYKDGVEAGKGKITAVCMSVATQKAEPLPVALAEALRRYLVE